MHKKNEKNNFVDIDVIKFSDPKDNGWGEFSYVEATLLAHALEIG